MTADLAVFLLTCLAADAQVAQAATRDARPMAPKVDDTWRAVRDEKRLEWWVNAEFTGSVAGTGYVGNSDSGPLAVHIALHDPAFVLADVAAKKAIVRLAADYPHPEPGDNAKWALDLTLRLLAQPFRGRPGWSDEWSL